MMGRIFASIAAALAAATVGLEAWSAHSVAAAQAVALWQTVVGQQKFLALGLLATGVLLYALGWSRLWGLAGLAFISAWLLFCVNIAARILWPEYVWLQQLRPLVPVGGGLHIAAWCLLGLGILTHHNPQKGRH